MLTEQTFVYPIPREILLNSNGVYHYRVKGLRVKLLRSIGEKIGSKQRQKTFDKYVVEVYVYPPTKRRLDPPNLYPTVKPLIDGMTDAHIWDDDDWKHMDYMKFKYGGESGMKDMFILKFIVKEID